MMTGTARNFAFVAGAIGIAALAGCAPRNAPVVSYAPKAQLGEYDALIVARGMS